MKMPYYKIIVKILKLFRRRKKKPNSPHNLTVQSSVIIRSKEPVNPRL